MFPAWFEALMDLLDISEGELPDPNDIVFERVKFDYQIHLISEAIDLFNAAKRKSIFDVLVQTKTQLTNRYLDRASSVPESAVRCYQAACYASRISDDQAKKAAVIGKLCCRDYDDALKWASLELASMSETPQTILDELKAYILEIVS